MPSTLDLRPSTAYPCLMKKRFRFENLDVWQEARRLNGRVYAITAHFPVSERFGLTGQLRRAAVSVSSNIAEGSGRNSDKVFAQFLEIAYGSLMEVASQIYLALDLSYVDEAGADGALEAIRALAAKVAALNRSMLVKESKVRVRPVEG
jgi:four helix bundle protein